MVDGRIESNEPGRDQIAASLLDGGRIHGKPCHDGSVGVVAESLGIGYGDQKKVKSRRRMGDGFNVAVTDQALIHPTELAGDLSDSLGQDGTLLDHDFLLSFELDH